MRRRCCTRCEIHSHEITLQIYLKARLSCLLMRDRLSILDDQWRLIDVSREAKKKDDESKPNVDGL